MKREPDETDPPAATFDWNATNGPAVGTLRAVAAVADTPPTDLPPLHRTVDTDALNALLEHMCERDTRGRVTFTYHGCHLVLDTDGTGVVYETDT